jgi:hypothetical protein
MLNVTVRDHGPIVLITVLLRVKNMNVHKIQYCGYATEKDVTNTVLC